VSDEQIHYRWGFRLRVLFFGVLFFSFLGIWTIYGVVFVGPEGREVFGSRAPGAGALILLFVILFAGTYLRMIIRTFIAAIILNSDRIVQRTLGGTNTILWSEIDRIELIEKKPFPWSALNVLAVTTGFYKKNFAGIILHKKDRGRVLLSCKDLRCDLEGLYDTLQKYK